MNPPSDLWREIRKALLHLLISGAALIAAIRGGIGWAEHGFHAPSRYGVTAGEDGSFSLLLIGTAFFLYGAFATSAAVLAARDAAHEDDTTENI